MNLISASISSSLMDPFNLDALVSIPKSLPATPKEANALSSPDLNA